MTQHARSQRGRPGILLGLVALGVVSVLGLVEAEDWPQFRGPGRLGVWHETGIVDEFPDSGLKFTWRVPIRSGFSGPAVADGRVFVTDWEEDPESRRMDGTERVLALDEQTGEVLWELLMGGHLSIVPSILRGWPDGDTNRRWEPGVCPWRHRSVVVSRCRDRGSNLAPKLRCRVRR